MASLRRGLQQLSGCNYGVAGRQLVWDSKSCQRCLTRIQRTSTRTMSVKTTNKWDRDVQLVRNVVDLAIRENLVTGDHGRDGKVVDFVAPADLGGRLCKSGLAISEAGIEDPEVTDLIENVVKYSVKTCHPYFYNQLYHGVDPAGVAGQWLADALNTNVHTFEVAPVFTVVEKALINYTIDKLGWTSGGDGITAPGGSMANMYGIMLARHRLFPEIKKTGLVNFGKQLVIFTSEDSHYSVVKGANWLGFGVENVVKVKTNDRGEMIPEELDKCIENVIKEGKVPLAVNATCGTTVLGGYDDLEAISGVCRKFNPAIWLHVDACWGGTVMLSNKHKHLLKGVDKVDSLAWNPHKMMGAPLQSNVFVTQKKNLLAECNSASAGYLFQQDKFYDVSYDSGDKSVQCGRKSDAFQIWFMLKVRGERYFEDLVDNVFDQAKYLADKIRSRSDFKLVVDPPSCTNVCFVYLPPSLRNRSQNGHHQNGADGFDLDVYGPELATVAPKIKEAMTRKGSLLIGYQPMPHKNLPNFFRMVIPCVPRPTNDDMDYILEEIERCGKDL